MNLEEALAEIERLRLNLDQIKEIVDTALSPEIEGGPFFYYEDALNRIKSILE